MTQSLINTNTHLGIDSIYIEMCAAPQGEEQCDLSGDVQTNKLKLPPRTS